MPQTKARPGAYGTAQMEHRSLRLLVDRGFGNRSPPGRRVRPGLCARTRRTHSRSGAGAPRLVRMTLISIVVPTHNELPNIEPLWRRISAVFEKMAGYDFELIFSDDSDDATPQR